MITICLFLNIILVYFLLHQYINSSCDFIISILFNICLIGFIFPISLFIKTPYSLIYAIITLATISIAYLGKSIPKASIQLPKLNNWSIFFVIGILIFNCSFISSSELWGGWDAWDIWAYHAKFLLFQDQWQNMFYGTIKMSHDDYPLMLPALTAIGWQIIGYSPWWPLILSYLACLLLMGLVIKSLKYNGFPLIAIVVFLIFCLSKTISKYGASQFADIWVSLTIAASIFLIQVTSKYHSNCKKRSKHLTLIMAGFFAFATAWCKNEGLIFSILISIFILLEYKIKDFLFFIAGAILPLSVLLYYKFHFPIKSDMIENFNIQTLHKALDYQRYATVIKFLFSNFVTIVFNLIIFSLFAYRFKYLKQYRLLFVFFIQWLIICAIYLLTYHQQWWHLATSYNRLVFQIIPGAIIAAFPPKSKKLSQ